MNLWYVIYSKYYLEDYRPCIIIDKMKMSKLGFGIIIHGATFNKSYFNRGDYLD